MKENKKRSYGTAAYIIRHVIRMREKSIVIILMIFFFLLCIQWLNFVVEKNESAIETLYKNTKIRATIIRKEESEQNGRDMSEGNRILMNLVFQDLKDSGYIAEENLEAVMNCSVKFGDIEIDRMVTVRGIMSVEGFQEIWKTGAGSFEWLEGYSETYFEQKYESAMEFAEHDPGVVVSDYLLTMTGASLGDYLDELYLRDGFTYEHVRIIGVVHDSNISDIVLVPLDLLEHQTESVDLDVIFYQKMYFTICPEWNQELDIAVQNIAQRLNKTDATMMVETKLVVFDDDLQNAIKPLEKIIRLIAILRPLVVMVFLLCIAGAAIIFTVLERMEIAVMKALGTPTRRVLLSVCGERLVTVLIGALTGSIGAAILFSYDFKNMVWGLLFSGVCLVVSVVVTAGTAAIWVKRDCILACLQAKE